MDIPLAALVPVIVLLAGFVAYCLYDLAHNEVKHLPKWVWGIICVVSVPMGGIVYLLMGRVPGGTV